jgi:hypothetical protein
MASQGVPFVLAVEIPANGKARLPKDIQALIRQTANGEPDLGARDASPAS